MSFGGQAWPINPLDFNAGQVNSGRNPLCLGAVFDLSLGTNNMPDSSTPTWVVGDTFLVRIISWLYRCPSYIVSSFLRKTCTRSSVPHHRLSGLPNCLLQLVEQVPEEPGLPRAPARVPRALALLLGFLVCSLFILRT
jgi:hypothetical protein